MNMICRHLFGDLVGIRLWIYHGPVRKDMDRTAKVF